MKTSTLISLVLLSVISFTNNKIQAQSRIYVDIDATSGSDDGTSWADAYISLSGALAAAGTGDTVWVAEGTYLPEHDRDWTPSPNSILATFSLPDSIVLLGGFSGDETGVSARDWKQHPVILSGDIGTAGVSSDNSMHVVFNADTAWMDGFIIEKGYGTTHSADYDKGAGIYNSSKLIISNCIIRENYCRYGAGVYCDDGSYLDMDHCFVYDNEAFYDGWGGSGEGGGIELYFIDYAIIKHSTIWANNGVGSWGVNGILTLGSTQTIVNSCIIWENAITNCLATYSCFKDATGIGNIDTDPMLSDPGNDNFNLMRGSPCINAGDIAADPDPDGTRSDMGAIDYPHDEVDLGILAFNHWDGGFQTGPQDVTVTLESFGTETLTSADINWEVDGVAQPVFNWTGSLGLYEDKDSIVIGTFDFDRNYHTLEAWIVSPNGKTDEYTSNDTLEKVRFACDSVLHDTFLLGPSHDYKTFTDAADALCNCGISGPTTFLVEDGVYLEQVTIPEVDGAGPSDSIVFSSLSGINQNVVLSWAPQEQSKPWTVMLDSADHITFNAMTIETRDSLFGHVIEIGAGTRNLNIRNCNIIGDTLSEALIYAYFDVSVDSTIHDISILDNYFRFGKTAIKLVSDGWPRMERIQIENNIIDDVNQVAIDLKYAIAPSIKNNLVRCGSVTTSGKGLLDLWYISGKAIISGNQIYKTELDGNPYGIRFQHGSASPGDEMLVYNNMISLNSSSYCFATFQTGGIKIYHNSLLAYGNGTIPLYLGGSDEYFVYNNNIVNLCGSAAANYAYTPVPDCNNNNYFAVGDQLILNGTNKPKTLDAWFKLSGEDEHSVNSISGFFDLADLHTASADLDSAGTPLTEVTVDIDSNIRNATHPDIGASEYAHPGYIRGDWIIGSSDTATFPNVISAFNWMYMLHVDSTTNLLLEPGQYKEQLVLHAVPGATKDNPVTLRSLSGDSSDTWISYYDQTLAKDYVYHLRTARHLHFRNLGFRSDSTTKYQGIIRLSDSCVDVSFSGCNFISSESTFSVYGDLISSKDYRNKDLKITGNSFLYGNNAISIYDQTVIDKTHSKVTISHNSFKNQNNAGIYTWWTEELIIHDNLFLWEPDYSVVGGMGIGIRLHNAYKGGLYKPMYGIMYLICNRQG